MEDDDRNYIERIQSRARAIDGREWTPEEMATNFAKNDLGKRTDVLEELDIALSRGGPITLEEASNLLPYVSALRGTHERLRKARR